MTPCVAIWTLHVAFFINLSEAEFLASQGDQARLKKAMHTLALGANYLPVDASFSCHNCFHRSLNKNTM